MKILNYNQKNLLLVIKQIKQGKVVIVPTETVYGLSARVDKSWAIDKIYQIKGRDFNKPLLVVVDSLQRVKKYFNLSQQQEKILKKYWPGAVTCLLRLKKEYKNFDKRCSQNGWVAVRVTSNSILKKIAEKNGGLIVSTSANIAGEKETRSLYAIKKQFKKKKVLPEAMLNVGRLKKNKPSTLIKILVNKIEVLRQGDVVIEED